MGWVYLLNRRLEEMNVQRSEEGRTPLTWREVEMLTGVKEGLLRNLAYNSILRTTNTRFLDSLCRFFGCELSELVQQVPEPNPGRPEQGEIDRLLEAIRSEHGETPDYHVDRLYGPSAEAWWRLHLTEIRAGITDE